MTARNELIIPSYRPQSSPYDDDCAEMFTAMVYARFTFVKTSHKESEAPKYEAREIIIPQY